MAFDHPARTVSTHKISIPPLTATRWLRKGIEDRAHCMPWLGIEPWTDPFRSDPRYASLLKEIGLTPIGAIAR